MKLIKNNATAPILHPYAVVNCVIFCPIFSLLGGGRAPRVAAIVAQGRGQISILYCRVLNRYFSAVYKYISGSL